MRSVAIGLALLLAMVPLAHAQQLAIPASAPMTQMDIRAPEVGSAPTAVDLAPADAEQLADDDRAPTSAEATAPKSDVVEGNAAAQQITARNVLAIVGGIVVVVALVALFN